MKVENDLRTMSSFLQVQLKDIKTLVESNKIDQAKENLKFVQGGLNNFANELEKVEGGFYGIIGFLFRRPYKVPDDLKNIRENLFIEAKTLQKELDKQSEKENNNKNRLSARAIKALKSGQLAILPTETVYGLFADAMNEEAVQKLYSVKGRPTEKALNMNISSFEDIIGEMKKPARDPREDAPPVIFRNDVKSFEDLKIDMELEGTVRNVVDFGAFVDIGVKNDGLVHISQMSDKYIKHPMDVVSVGDTIKVKIISIDHEKMKVGLTMKI